MELQANNKYSKFVKSVDFGLVLQKVKREDCTAIYSERIVKI